MKLSLDPGSPFIIIHNNIEVRQEQEQEISTEIAWPELNLGMDKSDFSN